MQDWVRLAEFHSWHPVSHESIKSPSISAPNSCLHFKRAAQNSGQITSNDKPEPEPPVDDSDDALSVDDSDDALSVDDPDDALSVDESDDSPQARRKKSAKTAIPVPVDFVIFTPSIQIALPRLVWDIYTR